MPHSNPITKNNVTITGNPDAMETMMFGHGFGTDQTAWSEVIKPFMSRYRIILYDMVGAGKADLAAFSPNRYDNLQAYAQDVVDICVTLNVKDAIMVAHSVSGMVSLLAAIQAPQHFSTIIMVGASPRYINDDDYIGGFTQEALNGLYAEMEKNYYAWVSGFAPMVMSNEDKPELTLAFAQTLSLIRPDIAISVVRTIFQSDYRSKLGLLNKPTLIIQSESDVAVPNSVGEYLHKHINNSKLDVVAAQGHFPHISAPQEVIHSIERFIA
jgi:sigma-B regulation protein RsbQ